MIIQAHLAKEPCQTGLKEPDRSLLLASPAPCLTPAVLHQGLFKTRLSQTLHLMSTIFAEDLS